VKVDEHRTDLSWKGLTLDLPPAAGLPVAELVPDEPPTLPIPDASTDPS